MAETKVEVRPGAYYDSVVLMQLQRALAALPKVIESGVVMGTPANKDLLAQSDLLVPAAAAARPDDLVIVVRAEDSDAAAAALAQVNDLLTRRRTATSQEYRPQSLDTAVRQLPDAAWVLISVAGRYAAGVARQALALGKHVFLFSDNVTVEDEIALKQQAAAQGLLVMGPDCGTALIGGFGLGFANKVRSGPIGLAAAAGTGLQQVSARIHQLGGGVSHGIGTGGRDLSEKVGAATFRQAIDLLSRDPQTSVIVLISKPPAPAVAQEVLQQARRAGKPVVVAFVGRPPIATQIEQLYFAAGLDHAAELAVRLAAATPAPAATTSDAAGPFAPGQRYLRGLFSGGTLAYEAQHILKDYIPLVWANAPLDKAHKLPNPHLSQEHTIVDLGEDEFTVGRLHPMMDNDLRIRRLLQEAADPATAVILLDVVLGFGAHPDPASELGPAIGKAHAIAAQAGRRLAVAVVVTGTDADPQGLDGQIEQLRRAGAWVTTSNEAATRYAGQILLALASPAAPASSVRPVDLAQMQQPLAAINVGLESFAENLTLQGAAVVQVDWRPPASGNERLAGILARMAASRVG